MWLNAILIFLLTVTWGVGFWALWSHDHPAEIRRGFPAEAHRVYDWSEHEVDA